MKDYTEGYKLEDNEYLLKIRGNCGFMTKLNKNGTIPVAFKDWNTYHYGESQIFVIEETFRSGWRLESYRFGLSQHWAILMHPLGFTVEIYLSKFLDIVKNSTVINGEIIGNFKWTYSELIKEN